MGGRPAGAAGASGLTAIERWEATEAIMNVQARYFRCLDVQDWPGFEAVFTADAEWEGGNHPGVMRTAAGIATEISGILRDAVTVHYGHTPELEIDSATTAHGTWAMEEKVWWPDGSMTHSYGHYHHQYAKVDGTWKISRTALSRLRGDRSMGARTEEAT